MRYQRKAWRQFWEALLELLGHTNIPAVVSPFKRKRRPSKYWG